MKKNNLFSKYVKLASDPAWKLKNQKVQNATSVDVMEDAITLSLLGVEMRYAIRFSAYGLIFPTAKQAKYDHLIEKHALEIAEGEEAGLKLFEQSFSPLADWIEKEGDKGELCGDGYRDQMTVLFKFYSEYFWLKSYHNDIPDGTESLENFIPKIQEAFQEVGIIGRFKWNIQ